jgi:Peroxidase
MDPAMYGDQELRSSAVNTVRESVRRAILQDPSLAPAFYKLALMDGLSYNVQKKTFGPNGNVIYSVFATKSDDAYTTNLKKAATVLIETEQFTKKKSQVSIADCIAIAGAEAIESIGGPVLPVQLGRLEVNKKDVTMSPLPVDILSGARSKREVREAFRSAGLTEREMTALLGALLTLERVEKTIPTTDWKASGKRKFVERGKMGRASDFKMLTDDDIKAAMEDEYEEDPDDGWYIADSFGTKDDRFGNRIAKDILNEANFNRYIQDLNVFYSLKKGPDNFGWIGQQIMDVDNPTAVAWLKKYADSNLSYTKDLKIAFNSLTQLGAVYTGGKYESLLKNKPRKSLDDDLNLGF